MAARFQINLLVEPIPSIVMYRDVPKKFIPILWFEQHVKMTKEIANEIKFVLKMPRLGQTIGIFQIVVGVLILASIPLKKLCIAARKRKVKDFDVNGNNLMPIHKMSEHLLQATDKSLYENAEKGHEMNKLLSIK